MNEQEFLARPSVFLSPVVEIEVEDPPHPHVDPIVVQVNAQTTTFLQNRYVEDYTSLLISISISISISIFVSISISIYLSIRLPILSIRLSLRLSLRLSILSIQY